jgi:single-strand DNA-binding protein|tara:strand:- start:2303 stop:2749 length:447 start_codon:yes stop_codon:yes gene_type:complete
MSDLRLPDLNKVFIAGRLTRDPEVRQIPSRPGATLCKMGVAVSRKYKTKDGDSREDTVFIDVIVWDKTATYCGEHLQKGRPILVEGRLKSDTWDDKDTGAKRSKIEIQGDRVQTLDWDGAQGGYTEPQPKVTKPKTVAEPVAEDDIPF